MLSPATRARNIGLAILGAAVLVLKSSYSGPLEEAVRSYAGNFAVTFALYFAAVSGTYSLRRPHVVAAISTLAAVSLFEITDGFGVMANVYDPFDLLANGAGAGLALAVDLLWGRLERGATAADRAVT